jgi:hypothetical protein
MSSTQTTEQYFDLLGTPEFRDAYYHSFEIKLSGSGDGSINGGAILDYLSTKGIYLTPEQFNQVKSHIQWDLEMATFKFLNLIKLENEVKKYLEEEKEK